MSEQEIGKTTCQIHENLEILAVDLTQSNCEQQVNKYLCVKCLIEKIGIKTIVLYDKTIDMIKEMKSKSKKLSQEITQEKVNNIKQLQQSIQDFDQLIKEVIGKLQNNVNQQIIESEKEIQLRDSQMDSINLEEDIQILSSLYQGNDQCEILDEKYNPETISQFLDSLEQSLYQISTSQQISKVYSSIKKIKQQFQINQEYEQLNKNKTPSLKQNCKIHEQEIIMVDISESENEQQNRFACVECIQQFANKYISIKEVNKKWNQYKQQSQEINSNYLNQRQSKFNLGIQIVSQFKQSFNNKINEIINSLETQYKLDQSITLIDNYQHYINIQDLDQSEILKVLNILSQKDQHFNLKQQQDKLNSDDSIFYCNLQQNLDYLIQQDIFIKSNLIHIFIDNQQELLDINYDSLDLKQSNLLELNKLNTEQSEQLNQLNQESIQLKKNEIQLQNQLQQNDNLIIKQKEQIQQYQQLQDTQDNKIKELNQQIQNIQSNLNQIKQQLQSKDQELKNHQVQHEELLKELKQVYSFVSISWTIGKSTILTDDFFCKIVNEIESKTKKKMKNQYFIYSGTKNGLNGQAFWKSVDKLSNLLIIFKSKSGNIFGAFSPCQWVCVGGSYVQDDTLSSFIFSQTHIQIYPIKVGYKQNAIYCRESYGPTFGGGHDINISTDFQGGYSSLGSSYQCDQYQISNKNTHLFGQTTPNIAECEIFMLTFV